MLTIYRKNFNYVYVAFFASKYRKLQTDNVKGNQLLRLSTECLKGHHCAAFLFIIDPSADIVFSETNRIKRASYSLR